MSRVYVNRVELESKGMYRIEEACLVLALARTKVYDEIAKGNLIATKVGKSYRISEDELRAYVDRAKTRAGL